MKPILQILVMFAVYLLTGANTNAQTYKETINGIVYDVYDTYYDKYAKVAAYQDTNLTGAITIANSVGRVFVKEIASEAFSNCKKIKSMSVPSSVTEWNYDAFFNCESLETINIPEGVVSLNSTFTGCKSLVNVVLPNSLKSLNGTFNRCSSLSPELVIPNSVTSIEGAFSRCEFETAPVLPDSVTNLYTAFSGCPNLKEPPLIPKGVKYMSHAFSDCPKLAYAPILPDSLKDLAWGFRGTAIQSVPFTPKMDDNFGLYGAFAYCTQLKNIEGLAEHVTSLGGTFQYCTNMETIDIPKHLKEFMMAFAGCTNLKNVYVHWTNLDSISASENCFMEVALENDTLWVPFGTTELYHSKIPWSQFGYIKEVHQYEVKTVYARNEGFEPFTTADIGINAWNGDVDKASIVNRVVGDENQSEIEPSLRLESNGSAHLTNSENIRFDTKKAKGIKMGGHWYTGTCSGSSGYNYLKIGNLVELRINHVSDLVNVVIAGETKQLPFRKHELLENDSWYFMIDVNSENNKFSISVKSSKQDSIFENSTDYQGNPILVFKSTAPNVVLSDRTSVDEDAPLITYNLPANADLSTWEVGTTSGGQTGIDGIFLRQALETPSDVEEPLSEKEEIDTDNTLYNLSGQRVSESYKGIIINNGKKYMKE